MRLLILVPLLLLPLAACMTQRDKTIWQEFKAEISGQKAADVEQKSEEVSAEPAASGENAKAASPEVAASPEEAASSEESSETIQVPEK